MESREQWKLYHADSLHRTDRCLKIIGCKAWPLRCTSLIGIVGSDGDECGPLGLTLKKMERNINIIAAPTISSPGIKF